MLGISFTRPIAIAKPLQTNINLETVKHETNLIFSLVEDVYGNVNIGEEAEHQARAGC